MRPRQSCLGYAGIPIHAIQLTSWSVGAQIQLGTAGRIKRTAVVGAKMVASHLRLTRRAFLVSAATAPLVNLALTSIPLAAAAAEEDGGSIAGQLAKWSLGQVGGLVGGIVVSQASELLGIDRSGGVNSKLQEINSKLDQLLAEMQALNTRLDQLSDQIGGLQNVVDIGLKDAYAQIDQTTLKSAYATIDRYFGSDLTASNANLVGLLRPSNMARPGLPQAVADFQEARAAVKNAVYQIHAQLTVSAGSSESLIQKWATLLIAKLHQKGPNASLEPSAQMLEAWFTAAVAQEMRAMAVLMFCDGSDSAKLAAAKQEIGGLIALQCSQYVDAMERMALVWARPAPSGPTRSPEHVYWMPGTQEWLLRADVLARALTVSFQPPSGLPAGAAVSGCYGRVLQRGSHGAAPQVSAFFPYLPQFYEDKIIGASSNWPELKRPVAATLGRVSEFQSTDWADVSTDFAQLRPPAQTRGLQFARAYWPVTIPNSIQTWPAPSVLMVLQGWHFGGGEGSVFLRSVNPKDLPSFRPYDTGRAMVYSLTRLAPYVPRAGAVLGSLDSFIADANEPLLTVFNFLDGWSALGPGPQFADSTLPSPSDVKFQGDDRVFKANGDVVFFSNRALSFSPPDWGKMLASNGVIWDPEYHYFAQPIKAGAAFKPAWNWLVSTSSDDRSGMSGNSSIPFFATSAGESGSLLVYLSGTCDVRRPTSVHGVWLRTRLRLSISDDQGYSQLLYDSLASLNTDNWEGDSPQQATLPVKVDFVPVPLNENRRYSLILSFESAGDWNHSDSCHPDCYPRHGEMEDDLQLIINELGVVRSPASGYAYNGP